MEREKKEVKCVNIKKCVFCLQERILFIIYILNEKAKSENNECDNFQVLMGSHIRKIEVKC